MIQPMVAGKALRCPTASPRIFKRDLPCEPSDSSTSSITPCRVQVSPIGRCRGARNASFNHCWGGKPYGITGPVPVSLLGTCDASLPIAPHRRIHRVGCKCRQSGVIGGPHNARFNQWWGEKPYGITGPVPVFIQDLLCEPFDRSTSSNTPCRVQVSPIGRHRGALNARYNQCW